MDNVTFSVSVNRLFAGQKLGMPLKKSGGLITTPASTRRNTPRFPCLQR
jgi:hypothetical protein